jgi:hypothetical protein
MARERGSLRIRVGPVGWSYNDWEGIVYPTNQQTVFQVGNTAVESCGEGPA